MIFTRDSRMQNIYDKIIFSKRERRKRWQDWPCTIFFIGIWTKLLFAIAVSIETKTHILFCFPQPPFIPVFYWSYNTLLFTEKAYKSWERFFAIFWLCKFTWCLFPCLPILSYQVRIYKRILMIPDLKEPTINLENKE
jgi:hypothetical protein